MSPFVGRDGELRRLAAAFALAAGRQGSTVFVTGQPGIGKTRLAEEALDLARERGFIVLRGRAFPLRTSLAYAPFLDAFGPFLRNLDSDLVAALVDGLPDLARLFASLRLPQPDPLGDPALEKTRLFEAVSRLLERITLRSPVVLFVDDLQWADPASLELLHYVAFGLAEQRALLLSTYDDEALNTSENLRALTLSLERNGLAEIIPVPRLCPHAVHQLVRGILASEVPEDLLAVVDARAGGTPLYVEALIRSLIDSGKLVRDQRANGGWMLHADGVTTLAPSVRHLVQERLQQVAPADRRLLDLIAVIGDATPHPILQAAGGLDNRALFDTLRRLMAAGLVTEGFDGPDVVYSITHPLIREVAHTDIPAMERRQYHVVAIQAIERLRPGELNSLARHYRDAGPEADAGRALKVLFAAGERARTVYANEEAAQHYDAALAIVRAGHQADSLAECGGPVLPCLLERLGDVWDRIGKHGEAIVAWSEALAEREGAGDILAASRLHHRLAQAEADHGHFDKTDTHITAGLAGLAGRAPSQELADLFLTRCYILSRRGSSAAQEESSAELLAIAEQLGSPLVEVKANLAASVVSLERSDVADAHARALRALTVAESFSEGQDLVGCYRAHGGLLLIGTRLGDHHLMRYHAEQSLAIAQRLGAPNLEILPRARMAYADCLSGAWNESLLNSLEAVRLARRVGHPRELAYSLAERAVLLALRGALSEAATCISEVRTNFAGGTLVDKAVFGLVNIAETAIALQQGEAKRALGIASGFVRQSALATVPAELTCRSMPIGLMLLAEAQAAAGDPEGALDTARQIAALGPTGTPYLTGLACRAEGLARQAMGQGEVAAACLVRAYDLFTALDIPFEAARSLLEQATIITAYRSELALEPARQSLTVFERLGARYYIDQARQLLQGLGVTLPAVCHSRPGGSLLSDRELQVARLVAEGLTTAEIAKRLVLSRRTISTHLDHIYRRLQIGSRSALTRYVVEAGLLTPAHEQD